MLDKASKLKDVRYEVRGPVLEEAEKMIRAGDKVLKLNIGNPAVFGFDAPEELFNQLANNIRSSQAYSDSKGIAPALAAIQAYHTKKGLPNVTEGGIYTGNGASELISMCMTALLDTGDEILIPAPDYPLWTASATLAGGKVAHYICDESAEWAPDATDIKKKITPRTKAIVVINPNNPTGALYGREALQQIVDIAREHDLIIFADEIYDRIVYEGTHTSIASLAPDLFCVTFNGLSKSHIICGFRCGWMVLSGDKSKAQGYIDGLNTLSSMRLCANVLSQQVIPFALGQDEPNPHTLPGGRLYEQGMYVAETLNDIPGVSVVAPKASMYVFPKLDTGRFSITSDQQFAIDFLHRQKVLIIQGTGFNWGAPDHFRIVFLPNIEDLQTAMQKLDAFLSTYQQH
jgi:alanine-synthesizing transaminase